MSVIDPEPGSPGAGLACVQRSRRGRTLPEFEAVTRELRRRGTALEFFTRRDVFGHRFHPPDGAFVVAEISASMELLDRLGSLDRVLDDYPAALAELLGRRIWTGSLDQLCRDPGPALSPVFVKPRRRKRFTGIVVRSICELRSLPQVSGSDEFLCAEVVRWEAEYRAYVLDSEILGTFFYAGVPRVTPDPKVIEEAVRRLDATGCPAAGYCLDLGILDTGETTLVEVNDAIALRNYGLPVAAFTELLLRRWQQLTNRS